MKFFAVAGAILILTGTLQVFFRPSRKGESAAQKIVNSATVRALLFLVVGTLGILVGLGVIGLPG